MSLEECSSSRRSTPKHVSCKNFKHLSSGTKQIGVSKEKENKYNTYIYTYRYRKRERGESTDDMVFEVGGRGVLGAFVADSKKKSPPSAHCMRREKQWRVLGERERGR